MLDINYLPFGLHTAFFATIFYGFGYLSKQIPEYISKTQPWLQYLLIITCFCIQFLCNKDYSSKINVFPFPYFVIVSIGIILYLTLSIRIKQNILIEFIGKNSLVILAFQEPVYRAVIFVFSKILNQEVESLRTNIWYSLIIVFSILIIVPAIYLYNNYIRQRINNMF